MEREGRASGQVRPLESSWPMEEKDKSWDRKRKGGEERGRERQTRTDRFKKSPRKWGFKGM